MNINKSNYESWFLDYHEGTLTAEKVAELFLFLEKYPEFKKEFESFAQITLPQTSEVFSLKDSLKKNTITSENYNDYLIAELEGDLNLQERVALKTFMDSHPELQKEKLLFSKTILQKEIVVYPVKAELKKRVLVVRKNNLAAMWIAIAAMILLLIGVYFMQRPEKIQVAQERNKGIRINREQKIVGKKENNLEEAVSNNVTVKKYASNIDNTLNKSQETASLPQEKGQESKANNKNQNASHHTFASIHHKKIKQVVIHEKGSQEYNAELAMISATKIETQLLLNTNEESPEKTEVQKISFPVASPKRTFNPLQLFDDAKTTAVKKINRKAGDEIFYASSKPNSVTEERLPFKSRMIKLFAWAVNKVSNDNVKVNTDFDMDGNLAAYQLSAGKFKVEKNF